MLDLSRLRKEDLQSLLEVVAAATSDANLSPEAARLVTHVALRGSGEHEIETPELCAILRCKGDKPVRAAKAAAVRYGYIRIANGGRRPDRFEPVLERVYPAPQGVTTEGCPAPQGGINPGCGAPQGGITEACDAPGGGTTAERVYPAPQGVTNPPSHARAFPLRDEEEASSPSPSSARVRSREEGLLREWLGPRGECLDRFAATAGHSAGWAASIWGWYHPPGATGENDGGGTRVADLRGIPPERHAAVLASAIGDYAIGGEPLKPRLFQGFVRKAADDERDDNSTTGRAGRGTKRPDPAGRGEEHPRRAAGEVAGAPRPRRVIRSE